MCAKTIDVVKNLAVIKNVAIKSFYCNIMIKMFMNNVSYYMFNAIYTRVYGVCIRLCLSCTECKCIKTCLRV